MKQTWYYSVVSSIQEAETGGSQVKHLVYLVEPQYEEIKTECMIYLYSTIANEYFQEN